MMIPDELTDAVHGAARAVPSSAPDLAVVLRRHRRRRRRLQSLSAAAAVLAVVGAAAVVRQPSPGQQALDPSPAAPASVSSSVSSSGSSATFDQRLPLGSRIALLGDDKSGTTGVALPPGLLELSPDGSTVLSVPRPDVIDDDRNRILLQDGRTVLLGSKDLQPGVSRTDGVDVTGLEIRLVVLNAAGAVTTSRNVRVQGQDVQLIGATATEAYLYRTPGRIVRHDLATGAEQPLTQLGSVPGMDTHGFAIESGLLLVTDAGSCRLSVSSVATGAPVGTVKLPTDTCDTFPQVRVSPDGKLVAIVSWDPFKDGRPSVSVLRVTDGRSAHFPLDGGHGSKPNVLGMAWSGAELRVVQVILASSANKLYPLSEVMTVRDIPTGL